MDGSGSSTLDPNARRAEMLTISLEREMPPVKLYHGRIITIALLLRILVGYAPYSGQNNHHGANGGRWYGDYEAQRHWMEVALHVDQPYYYDVKYWGLDYPPLSLWQSYLCGRASKWFVGEESVALDTSRGYESPRHKTFMRLTVLCFDLIFYMSVVVYLLRDARLHALVVLAQPSLLVMDHGHFQYNCVALGLALWAFRGCTSPRFASCIAGSVCFCASISFKQMALYYAPATFFFLLGRCYIGDKFSVQRFAALAVTVVLSMSVFWGPTLAHPPDGVSVLQHLRYILWRIFPLYRGLFEHKVANLWFVMSIKPLRIPQRLPALWQPGAALALTCVLMTPACVQLFRQGQRSPSNLRQLLWGVTSCALAFFLASYQVHEKSLLLALAPASLLALDDPDLIDWFSLVATWTLWPLLVLDRLQLAYVCVLVVFAGLVRLRRVYESTTTAKNGFFDSHPQVRLILGGSLVVMALLHAAELSWEAPPTLPDLFPVLWSVVGCSLICIMYAATIYHLYSQPKIKVM